MDYTAAIASQPANLAASRAAVTAALADLDLQPWRQGTIAVASIGASSHAGHIFAHALSEAGRRIVLIDAAELSAYRRPEQLADAFVFVTEGGRSRETIAAAEAVAGRPRLALTNVPHAPIGPAVDSVIALGHGPDSRVYTVGFTATVQAFGLLAEQLTGVTSDDWTALPDVAGRVLAAAAEPGGAIAKQLSGLRNIDVVGSGAALSAVQETALMLREGPRIVASAYETYQYLHGPMEAQTAESGLLLLGGDREIALARYAARRGITSVLITDQPVEGEPALSVIRLPELGVFGASIAQILPVQVLVGELTRLAGVDIDEFLYDQDDTKVGPPLAGEGH